MESDPFGGDVGKPVLWNRSGGDGDGYLQSRPRAHTHANTCDSNTHLKQGGQSLLGYGLCPSSNAHAYTHRGLGGQPPLRGPEHVISESQARGRSCRAGLGPSSNAHFGLGGQYRAENNFEFWCTNTKAN